MRHSEPEFAVWEHVTITKDPRTGLVIALGGTEQASCSAAASSAPPATRHHEATRPGCASGRFRNSPPLNGRPVHGQPR
jgi:hypothetical protein